MREKMKKIDRLTMVKSMAFLTVMFLITSLAWHCDDAYHGFVMARNLVKGNGFVYNIGERVNASTCPLFTLLVAGIYAILGGGVNMYLSGILACLICSGAALFIVFFKCCKSCQSVLCALLFIGGAGAFITYATSGLENCLLFLLMALFCYFVTGRQEYGRRDLFYIAFLIGMLMTTRMDNILLAAPVTVYVFFFEKRKSISVISAIGTGIAGAFPFWAWEIFSVVYYGFPFPNPAYIKLGTGFPRTDYFLRGISYMMTALLNDPVLLVLPVIYAAAAIKSKNRKQILLMAGVWLYLVYVVYIGGDFMLGRHLTVPYFTTVLGLLLLAGEETDGERMKRLMAGTSMITAACLCFSLSFGMVEGKRYLYGKDKKVLYSSDIADERAYYFPATGIGTYFLTRSGDYEGNVTKTWSAEDVEEMLGRAHPGGELYFAPGIKVYYYCEEIPVYDAHGLGDAFLARLPAIYEENWRVGHMRREIPAGYEETVTTGQNCIEDEKLHEFYDALSIVIKGDIWSWERFQTIFKMNTGYYNKLLEYEKQ